VNPLERLLRREYSIVRALMVAKASEWTPTQADWMKLIGHPLAAEESMGVH
jgi:hypothetical protein